MFRVDGAKVKLPRADLKQLIRGAAGHLSARFVAAHVPLQQGTCGRRTKRAKGMRRKARRRT